jgi:hypothetical protein
MFTSANGLDFFLGALLQEYKSFDSQFCRLSQMENDSEGVFNNRPE